MTLEDTRVDIGIVLLNLAKLSIFTFCLMIAIFFFNTEILPTSTMIMLLAWNFIFIWIFTILSVFVIPSRFLNGYTSPQSYTPNIVHPPRRVCNACNGTGRCNYCCGTGHIGAANVYIKNASKSCTPCSSTGVCRVCKGTGMPSSSTYD